MTDVFPVPPGIGQNADGTALVFDNVTLTAAAPNFDGPEIINSGARGGMFYVRTNSLGAGESYYFTVQFKDFATNLWNNIETVLIDSIGSKTLWIYPGMAGVAGVSVNQPLPMRIRARISRREADANVTGTVGIQLAI